MTDKEREIEEAYKELYALWDKNATPELDAEYKRQEDLADAFELMEDYELSDRQKIADENAERLEALQEAEMDKMLKDADRALKERRRNQRLIDMSGDDSSLNPAFS